MKMSTLAILTCWFIMQDTCLYADIYSMTLNQILSLRAEGSFKSSILQFSFNYAYGLSQNNFNSSFTV